MICRRNRTADRRLERLQRQRKKLH